MTKPAYSQPELVAKAERYCVTAERCRSEIEEKLYTWGASTSQRENILEQLEAQHFYDEVRYADAFTHDKLLFQGWGKIKIRAALRQKHIDNEIISASIEKIDEKEYSEIIRKVAQKKRGCSKEQVIRFMLQRGFSYDDIRQVTCGDYVSDMDLICT